MVCGTLTKKSKKHSHLIMIIAFYTNVHFYFTADITFFSLDPVSLLQLIPFLQKKLGSSLGSNLQHCGNLVIIWPIFIRFDNISIPINHPTVSKIIPAVYLAAMSTLHIDTCTLWTVRHILIVIKIIKLCHLSSITVHTYWAHYYKAT